MRKTTAVAKRKRKSDGETPEMRIEMWPINRPLDYPKNARKWSQAAIDKVTTSLREFGFRQPIVVDRHDVIIIGHLRRVAARAAGFTAVPVHVADMPAGKVRQLRLMDNRSHDEAQWDLDVLAEEMAELSKLDLDLSFTGFDEREYVSFMAGSGLTDPDEVPEAPAIPVTQAGDLWLMGDHRVLCGDAGREEQVARVRGGDCASLLFADPPYGVSYGDHSSAKPGSKLRRSKFKPIAGDEYNPVALLELLTPIAQLSATCVSGAAYVCHPDALASRRAIEDAFILAGWPWKHTIIWRKPCIGFGFSDYRNQHECIFYSRGSGRFFGDKAQSTVWELGRDSNYQHPTQKPVELVIPAITNSSEANEFVYDPFLGSGTTLLACEKTSRKCFGVELDDGYCDVIVTRWQNFTGKAATLDGDGRTFAEIAAERAA